LRLLHRARTLTDLPVPPGNRLEAFKGDQTGRYSIRVNDQYRICFHWEDADAYDVELTDYHRIPDRKRSAAESQLAFSEHLPALTQPSPVNGIITGFT